jgi:hypothetical protein
MDSREEAILKTLLYSDLFDYPLRQEELYNFLIGKKISKSEFTRILNNTKLPIAFNDGFYFLKNRQRIVQTRQVRERISLKKLVKAEKIINKLSLIPTIKLIGISGTLAMRNCVEGDDIDIFVIAEKGFAWTTRFLTAFMLIIMGVYRNKNSQKYQDKICLNLILDENKISFKEKDLFTAHEIVQLLPVFEKDKTYRKFLTANSWVKNILPNFEFKHESIFKKQQSDFDKLLIAILKIIFLEKILKKLQLLYMRKSITREKLEDGFIGLHPFDYRSYILKKYSQKLTKSGLK